METIIPDIIVPSCKTEERLSEFIGILSHNSRPCKIIVTCMEASASVNRNYGLSQATSPIVIMVDDDTAGFYPGWWQEMVNALENDFYNISLVSARLITANGQLAPMMHGSPCVDYAIVPVKYAPSACIAFRNDGLRFNEGYIGSGYEDTDFCEQIKVKYPDKNIVINNRVKIIHHNEQKNQHGEYYVHNKALYESLWPGKESVF